MQGRSRTSFMLLRWLRRLAKCNAAGAQLALKPCILLSDIRITFYYSLHAAAMQSRGSDAGYVESKPVSVVQSAQQQSLMSSVYLPTNNYLYHSDDDDDDHRVRYVNHMIIYATLAWMQSPCFCETMTPTPGTKSDFDSDSRTYCLA